MPKVQTQSLFNFLRPATGVSGQVSLSDSDEESRLSPVCGERTFNLLRPLCGSRRFAGEDGDRSGDIESTERLLVLRLRYEPSVRCDECEDDESASEDPNEDNEAESGMLSSDEVEIVNSEAIEPEAGDSTS